MAKWRDTAWKRVLCAGAQSAIDYLMPDLAADMDSEGEINSVSGVELFSDASDSNKYMRETDVFFNIPMLDRKNGNVVMFTEQQHDPNSDLPERVFETFIRMREKWRQRTTCIVIYTGSAPNVNTYTESCYGFKVAVEFKTYYLPEKTADELRADHHPFALVMLAARLSLDAEGNKDLREKYAMEILETIEKRSYDEEKKFFILKFAERIFQLSKPDVSEKVRKVYKMQMVPIKEYAHKVELECERQEGAEERAFEIARSLLAGGMPPQEVARHTELSIEDLQYLMPH